MNRFKKITIDISNICNAKCKWCTTGIRNKEMKVEPRFMTKDEFRGVIEHCLSKEIIEKNCDVELYSWGEPFLNPDIIPILDIIVEKGFPYNLSTNGCKAVLLNEEHVRNIKFMMFSLSGFSQRTYGRIHGLDLNVILANIKKMVEPFRQMNMLEKVEVNFHVYQFNIGEISECAKFCNEFGIRFVPRYAYLADWNLCNDYLTDQMKLEQMKEVSKELLFHYYDKLVEEMPDNYNCPQNERLFINSCGNVLPCACATDDVLGNIYDMTYEDIVSKKNSYYRCEPCLASGQAYIIQQYTEFLSEYDSAVEEGIKYYGEKLTPALYYRAAGEEYTENQKIKTSCVVRKNGEFIAKFCLPSDTTIQQIRFDPCEYPCSLINLIITCDGRKMNYSPYNAVINKTGYMKFETADPCVLCEIDTIIQNVEICGTIR